ncbi:MAG: TRAP transporter small permease subunit [Betaproteobacteria bacterium]|nr:TRAP transporter small permease subunit [Betaproteobacteria bacterium]
MQSLLALSKLVDRVNEWVGRIVIWLVLVVVLISAGNAVMRKAFSMSSNAWLELQWYLFGAIFLLMAGYTLLRNGHVRVDILSSRLSRRQQIGIEIFGVIVFLLPMAVLILVLSWPMFVDAWVQNETSSNAGGLLRWPAKLLIPVGFTLLVLAGISHLIKCVGFLMGRCPDPTARAGPTEEELLAAEIAAERSNSAFPGAEGAPVAGSEGQRARHGSETSR